MEEHKIETWRGKNIYYLVNNLKHSNVFQCSRFLINHRLNLSLATYFLMRAGIVKACPFAPAAYFSVCGLERFGLYTTLPLVHDSTISLFKKEETKLEQGSMYGCRVDEYMWNGNVSEPGCRMDR